MHIPDGWREFQTGGYRVCLPAWFKPNKKNFAFTGRLRPKDTRSGVTVFFVAVDEDAYRTMIHEAKAKPITEWAGTRIIHHNRGFSLEFPEAIEAQNSSIHPNGDTHHRWGVVFRMGERFLSMDFQSHRSSLTWEEFEEFGLKVLRTIEPLPGD